MSDHKTKKHSDFNYGRRQFLVRDIPGAVVTGYAVRAGIAAAALQLLLTGTEQKAFGSETVHYPGYHEQQKRLKQTGEWQVRTELENLRLGAGEVCIEEIYNDSKIEYRLIGRLKRYDCTWRDEKVAWSISGVELL